MPQLSEWSQKLLVSMRADTSDIKAKLRDLSGTQKQAAAETLKAAEAENAALDRRMSGLKKLAVGVGAVVIATKAWTAATDAYVKAAGPADERARAIVSANKSMAEALTSAKVAVGGLLAAFSPLVEILANVAMGIALVTRGLGDFVHEATRAIHIDDLTGERAAGAAARERARRQMAAARRRTDAAALERFRAGLLSGSDALMSTSRTGRRGGRGAGGGDLLDVFGFDLADLPSTADLDRQERLGGLGGLGGMGAGLLGAQGAIAPHVGTAAGLSALGGKGGDMFNALQQQISPAKAVLEQLGGAFDMVGNAASAAFEAMVTGSMSAGKAIKEMAAAALIGGGAQMAGEAIKAGVMALVSLAWGDIPAATKFGTAAAQAGVGAAAIYGLARGLGVGGSQGGGAAASALHSVNPYGAGGNVSTTVYIGADWQDPRAQSMELSRAIRKGQRRYGIALGSPGGVEYR